MLTICESFASRLRSRHDLLRATCVEHQSLQLTTSATRPQPAELSCVSTIVLPPLAGQSLMLIDIQTSVVLMKRLLGGGFEPETEVRKFTDIEYALAEIYMRKFLENFRAAADKTVPMEADLLALENNPAFLGTMSNGETVILLASASPPTRCRGRSSSAFP